MIEEFMLPCQWTIAEDFNRKELPLYIDSWRLRWWKGIEDWEILSVNMDIEWIDLKMVSNLEIYKRY